MKYSDLEFCVIGGAVLGGGGGGSIEDGLRCGSLAIDSGNVILTDPSKMREDAVVVTVVAVGAPAQRGRFEQQHFVRAVELLVEAGVMIDGLIAAENGAFNTICGWIPASALNIPVVDVSGDGRAHPTVMMGSMGLHRLKGYASTKSAVSGEFEVIARGSLDKTSKIIRGLSVEAGGMIIVARDPITVQYALSHGARGGTSKAHNLGRAILKAKEEGANSMINEALKYLDGRLVSKGRIEMKSIESVGGFDKGLVSVKGPNKDYELTFLNEYMTLETNGKRIATFPDLICTFDAETGLPITSAELVEGDDIVLTITNKELIPLGDGLRYSEAYEIIEKVLQKDLTHYLKSFLKV